MHIKEFRIPMPLSVEEYRVAQRYMIAKKSLEESSKGDGGVEIVENKPYTDGPGGTSGQYTKKIYHVGSHLPAWMKSVIPKSALSVYEEAWNAYPYTLTKYQIPMMEKFNLEIETVYKPDNGNGHANVFQLRGSDLSRREVEHVNLLDEPYTGNPAENPRTYVSSRTGRGPLQTGWENNHDPIMCSYKLIRIEFKYWGLQSRIEHYIADVGLRRFVLSGHQQAWAWQDEWISLTMDDVLKMEMEVAEKLGKVMAGQVDNETHPGLIPADSSGAPIVNAPTRPLGLPEIASEDDMRIPLGTLGSQSLPDDTISEEVFWDAEDDGTEFPPMEPAPITSLPDMSGDEGTHRIVKRSLSERLGLNLGFPGLKPGGEGGRRLIGHMATTGSMDQIGGGGWNDQQVDSGQPLESQLVLAFFAPSLFADLAEDDLAGDFKTFVDSVNGVMTTLRPDARDAIHIVPVYLPSITSRENNRLLLSVLHRYPDISSVPLEAMVLTSFGGPTYEDVLARVVDLANTAMGDFLSQNPNYQGKVSVIADRTASVAVYDSLCACGNHLSFNVTNFFTLGSPLGLVLAFRQSLRTHQDETDTVFPPQPPCEQMFNIFQSADPLACRLEPLFDQRFSRIDPVNLISVLDQRFQIGQESTGVFEAIRKHEDLFPDLRLMPPTPGPQTHLPQSPAPQLPKSDIGDPGASRKSSWGSMDWFSGSKPRSNSVSSTSQKMRRGDDDHQMAKGKSIDNIHTITIMTTDSGDMEAARSGLGSVNQVMELWWGVLRVDYQLPSPPGLQTLGPAAVMYATQGSYLQSKDVIDFVLKQLIPTQIKRHPSMRHGNMPEFRPMTGPGRWNKRRTRVVVAGARTNHRAKDALVLYNRPQILHAKFSYGRIHTALAGEDVEIYILTQPPYGEWVHCGTVKTSESGRVNFEIPPAMTLGVGTYPVVFLVKGDHSMVESQLFVIRPNTEAVVFSIDGSFAASTSITGADPKLQARAVDIVREWSSKEYLIVYVTSRPDVQALNVVSWLARHNFPLGTIHFCSSIQGELPGSQKTEYLKRLVELTEINIKADFIRGGFHEQHMGPTRT
eukprot:comp14595_c0_seq1/m.10871 comp14595_c0_seq1/g.10871  ORF comp14595_c0_seq1/g.10871 comp14595_c0_seq1/m.10871 type:complete len:1074 (-) comp14595_c0_seq1:369-3590(-)